MSDASITSTMDELSLSVLDDLDFYSTGDIFSSTYISQLNLTSNENLNNSSQATAYQENSQKLKAKADEPHSSNVDLPSLPSRGSSENSNCLKQTQSSSQCRNLKNDQPEENFVKPPAPKAAAKKKKVPQFCPQCERKYSEKRPLKYYQVSLDHSILLCSTDKCTYPFDTPNETLSVRDESIEQLTSGIDFDINNIPIEKGKFKEELAQLQSLSSKFLETIDHLKKDYERLESGLYKFDENQVENNELENIINQAFEIQPSTETTNVKPSTSQGDHLVEPNVSNQRFSEQDEESFLDQLIQENQDDVEEMLRAFI